MAAFGNEIPFCDCRLYNCKICNPEPSIIISKDEYKEDIKFLSSLLPDWVKEVPKNLCPTFYGTGTYEGDIKIKNKVDSILRKYS